MLIYNAAGGSYVSRGVGGVGGVGGGGGGGGGLLLTFLLFLQVHSTFHWSSFISVITLIY